MSALRRSTLRKLRRRLERAGLSDKAPYADRAMADSFLSRIAQMEQHRSTLRDVTPFEILEKHRC